MLARLRSLWRNLRYRDRVDSDLDREVRAVFDILVDEKLAAGQSLDQARRAATLELGRVESVTQAVREERAGATVDALLKDIRYGARMLRANPGFTFVVVVSLAIGIGANTALFSVANALLIRALPVPDPSTLFTARQAGDLPPQVSYPIFEQLRAGFPTSNAVAAMSRIMRVQARSVSGEPSSANMQLVSGEFFDVMRLRTSIGRLFTADDNRTLGGHPIAVIADSYWRRHFNGAADIVGRDLSLNGARFTIVGVAPPGFSGVWLESPVDVWIPLAMQAQVRYIGNFSANNANLDQPWMPQEGIRWIELLVRAGSANGPEAAALNTVLRPLLAREADAARDPDQRRATLRQTMILEPFGRGASSLRDRFRAPLFFLMTMVGVLLLVACVNAASLMVARAAARQREMAVRLSLGASRTRIISQLLTESVLLSTMAAIAGLALAPLASTALVRMTLGVGTNPLPFSVGVDGRVMLFTAALALGTSLLFGLAPAWRAADPALINALRANARGTRSGARLNLQKALVTAQVALSLLLIVGAGLFLRTLTNLAATPLGFDADHVVSASINPRSGGYAPSDLPALYRRIVERVQTLPGVEAAAFSTCGLMTNCRSMIQDLVIEGYQPQPDDRMAVQENPVSAGYVRAAGMSMVAGREFTPRDIGAKVAIVNETMARRYFGDRSPIGTRIGRDAADTEIIGVVRDARVNSVREAAMPAMLVPIGTPPPYLSTLLIRTNGEPATLISELRRALQQVEPGLPVDRVVSVASLAQGSFRQETIVATLTTALGVVALGLAALGLYGLMSYAVRQRTAELGIRFALGAPRPAVLWMVFRESLMLMVAGILIGVPLVAVTARLIGSLLFDVDPGDPPTIAAAIAILIGVGALAGYLPAWRASRVDPLTALRTE
ncbi:MAG TPA: ABC transporter permease [Vicinamibacterales bacterium]|nr:ABC transporter permease [Vicinamibacterales bacterium]